MTCLIAVFCALLPGYYTFATAAEYLSPTAMAATDKTLFIACTSAKQILFLDEAGRRISSIAIPLPPSGLALAPDGTKLFVTCAAPESKVCVVDIRRQRIIGTLPAGHAATSPVLSLDGKTLYVCNQFDNNVSVIDLAAKRELYRIAVQREPVAADITKDGKFLLVANQLPTGRADRETVAAVVSVIDLSARKVVKKLQLANGSGSLKDIRVSPDGKYAAVTHIVSSFSRATTKVQSGWMNANALTVIDLARMEIAFSLLLDEPNRGASNPWGLAWAANGQTLAVAHSGTHEISLINFQSLLASRVSSAKDRSKPAKPVLTYISHYEGMDPGLPFLTGARVRIKLPTADLGPRSLISAGSKIYAANYYSDTLSVIDLDAPIPEATTIPLGPKSEMDVVRKGDFYFHNATLCLQGWQSCSELSSGRRAGGRL